MTDVSLSSLKGGGGVVGSHFYSVDRGPVFEENGNVFLRSDVVADAATIEGVAPFLKRKRLRKIADIPHFLTLNTNRKILSTRDRLYISASSTSTLVISESNGVFSGSTSSAGILGSGYTDQMVEGDFIFARPTSGAGVLSRDLNGTTILLTSSGASIDTNSVGLVVRAGNYFYAFCYDTNSGVSSIFTAPVMTTGTALTWTNRYSSGTGGTHATRPIGNDLAQRNNIFGAIVRGNKIFIAERTAIISNYKRLNIITIDPAVGTVLSVEGTHLQLSTSSSSSSSVTDCDDYLAIEAFCSRNGGVSWYSSASTASVNHPHHAVAKLAPNLYLTKTGNLTNNTYVQLANDLTQFNTRLYSELPGDNDTDFVLFKNHVVRVGRGQNNISIHEMQEEITGVGIANYEGGEYISYLRVK